jgi:hypothetical protein
LGKRTADNARRLMVRLQGRLERLGTENYKTIRVSTDGFLGYPEAVDLAFGRHARYGQLIKQYRNAKMQYSPSEIIGAIRRPIRGKLTPWSICTSHNERNNLTIRTFMRRFTRLALGFSKKLANLQAAVDLHVAYFNFCWKPGEMEVTPAEAAGITDHCWSFDELLAG